MTKLKVLTVLLSIETGFSQGTAAFAVDLSGSQAAPPNVSSQTAHGDFTYTLSTRELFGRVSIPLDFPVTSMALFQSSSASELGAQQFTFEMSGFIPPLNGSGGVAFYSVDANLTPTQESELFGGDWWVNASTPTYPNGEIRGEVAAVPEPKVWALFSIGLVIALYAVRRHNNRPARLTE